MKRTRGKLKSNVGITLVALVVTIIVLVILASISIGAVFSEKGIIQQAKDAKKTHEDARRLEEENLNELLEEYKNSMNGTGGSGSGGEDVPTPMPTPIPTPSVPTGPNGNQLVSSITDTEHDTITAEDDKGNKVVVPNGFKFAEDSGQTVQDGIVIEDSNENQFVWIPVSNLNHDGSNKIVRNDGTEVEITLGRYSFDKETGIESAEQYAEAFDSTIGVVARNSSSIHYYEYVNTRESTSSTTNSTAKDLIGFIASVDKNGGFLLSRYEMSYGSGKTFGVGNDSSYYVPMSKESTSFSTTKMAYTKGQLWNFITQPNASKVGRQMYYGNEFVESDLTNSYMWDTALVYIQGMGNYNYSNSFGEGVTNLKNTGTSTDKKCNIYDIGGNLSEFTTEYCNYNPVAGPSPCGIRGGNFSYADASLRCACGRTAAAVNTTLSYLGFRVGVWLR